MEFSRERAGDAPRGAGRWSRVVPGRVAALSYGCSLAPDFGTFSLSMPSSLEGMQVC
jgi:hypothetical protein